MASSGGDAPPASDGRAPSPSSTSRAVRGDGHRGRGPGRGRAGGRGRGRGDGVRGGGRGRGRGRGNSQGNPAIPTSVPADASTEAAQSIQAAQAPKGLDFKSRMESQASGDDGEAEVCFICANPISHHAIAPCNHITCHICALRLRALYKSKDCPHCRTAAPFVIFTDDVTKRFESYTNSDITSTDNNIGIRYANEDIVGDTVLLLRYNCPDASCDFAGLGWPDLHRHVRSAHHKKMCDLCTRNKKVFTHEHELFADKELEKHMRRGDDRPGAIDQTGFKGHPLCDFCGERFYDGDKLYEHCRHKHERCFICDRRDSRQPHYYQDYNALERHFGKDHFPCLDRECQEKKFVVFESEMDLKAHQLSEHADSLSKDVRRDARLVDMSSFDYRPTYQQERRGGQSSREPRGGRGRDPNAEQPPVVSAPALRRDELAYQRHMAIHSAQSVTTRTFGGQLSNTSAPSRPNQPSQPSTSQPAAQLIADAMETLSVNDLSSMTPEQRASLARHSGVIERASSLLGKDASKTAVFRSHVSSYNRGSVTAEQLIDAFFALFSETSSNALGTLVREVADLFEDKHKAEALRKAWQNWRAINEDYPSLPGLGGMHGATTSSSGWANAAAASPTTAQSPANAAAQQKHSTRVLRLKNSTRRGSGAGLGANVPSAGAPSNSAPAFSRAVAPSAPVSSAFPALPSASTSTRAAQPSWIGGMGATSRSSTPRPGPTPSSGGGANIRRPTPAGRGGEDAFPALPAAPKPLTTIFGYGRGAVRRDFGGAKDSGFSWGGGAADSGAGPAGETEAAEVEGGKKGGKKKKKQVLAQWG